MMYKGEGWAEHATFGKESAIFLYGILLMAPYASQLNRIEIVRVPTKD